MTTRLALCAALLISLCGCFDYTEDVTVHENEQGTHKIEFRLHEAGDMLSEEELEELRREIEAAVEELKSYDEVVDAEGDAKIDDADLVTYIQYTAKRFLDMGRIGQQARSKAQAIAAEHDLDGQFRWEELDGGKWRWTYPTYDEGMLFSRSQTQARSRQAKRALATGKTPEETQALLDEELEAGSITYRFHAPQVFEADGAELDGGDAVWSYPLDPADDFDVPAEISAEFTVTAPFPWGYALIGGGLSCALVGGMWLRRKWNKRWE